MCGVERLATFEAKVDDHKKQGFLISFLSRDRTHRLESTMTKTFMILRNVSSSDDKRAKSGGFYVREKQIFETPDDDTQCTA